jgi:DNA end-binding protein Ku
VSDLLAKLEARVKARRSGDDNDPETPAKNAPTKKTAKEAPTKKTAAKK